MLLQIRNFIEREGVVSSQQLCRSFALELSALQPMLEFWINKGLITRCHETTACQSSCFKCHDTKPEYYQWQNTHTE